MSLEARILLAREVIKVERERTDNYERRINAYEQDNSAVELDKIMSRERFLNNRLEELSRQMEYLICEDGKASKP